MAKTVTVELSEPLIGHKGPIQVIVLREPKAAEYWEYGEPTRLAYTNGFGVKIENDEAIKAYIEAVVTEPKDPLLLGQLNLKDARAVKKALLGFFTEKSESS